MDQSGTFGGGGGGGGLKVQLGHSEGKCVDTNGFHFSSGASSSRQPTL